MRGQLWPDTSWRSKTHPHAHTWTRMHISCPHNVWQWGSPAAWTLWLSAVPLYFHVQATTHGLHTHTHYKHPLYSHTHTHFHYAAIHSATALYTQAPGAPGERKGSANKLSPGPELRFQPSVHRGWEAMGTWSARGPVSIRSSGSTQWGPACRQHCWQIYTQKSLWMGRRLVHTFTRVNTHTHRIKNRAVCGCPQCQCLMITSLCVHIAQQTAVLMPTRK